MNKLFKTILEKNLKILKKVEFCPFCNEEIVKNFTDIKCLSEKCYFNDCSNFYVSHNSYELWNENYELVVGANGMHLRTKPRFTSSSKIYELDSVIPILESESIPNYLNRVIEKIKNLQILK